MVAGNDALVRETLHFAHPVSPLFADTLAPAISKAVTRTLAEYGGIVDALDMVVVDHFVYTRVPERTRQPSDQGAPRDAPTFDVFTLAETWTSTHVARVEGIHARLRQLAVPTASRERAARDLPEVDSLLAEQLALHYEVNHLTRLAMGLLEKLVRNAGETDAASVVALALTPCGGRLREIDDGLANVARLAVDAGVEADVAVLHDARGALGEAFRQVWTQVADRPLRVDLAAPTWAEDPTPVLRVLAEDDATRERVATGLTRARERQEQAILRILAHFPAGAHEKMRAIIGAVRDARAVQQTMNLLAGEIGVGLTRHAYLRAGAALAREGIIEAAEDIMLLRRSEIGEALRDGILDPAIIPGRRTAFDAAWHRNPPQIIGTIPADVLADAELCGLLGMAGATDTDHASSGQGLGASPGITDGPVRVVRHDADLESVEAGDVVVVVNLAPAWTSIMHRAAAIITETGGLLCHAAIVAREMGKPAVVGVQGATGRLAPGDRVRINGETGAVERIR